jgi:hypothetical protein
MLEGGKSLSVADKLNDYSKVTDSLNDYLFVTILPDENGVVSEDDIEATEIRGTQSDSGEVGNMKSKMNKGWMADTELTTFNEWLAVN